MSCAIGFFLGGGGGRHLPVRGRKLLKKETLRCYKDKFHEKKICLILSYMEEDIKFLLKVK